MTFKNIISIVFQLMFDRLNNNIYYYPTVCGVIFFLKFYISDFLIQYNSEYDQEPVE